MLLMASKVEGLTGVVATPMVDCKTWLDLKFHSRAAPTRFCMMMMMMNAIESVSFAADIRPLVLYDACNFSC